MLPGDIARPSIHWSYRLGGSENECFPVPGTGDLLFAYGGCIVRTDGTGSVQWKSGGYGINAIAAVEDLDGDGEPEIIASTGYQVIVLSSANGELLFRNYVGFPTSAGSPANMILCHRFDTASKGMHLIVPLMSSKEVKVFDFRGGNGTLAHTLWMDDAYHPTVAAADIDNDGIDELVVSKLCGLYVFDVLSGAMKSSVRWTSNGERHRNYGLLQLVDIDGDGTREVVIVAERVARHLAVIDNDGEGSLSLLWDRFIEFIYPNDTTEVRHTGNSVQDVDGDGLPEIVVALFNARADGRWWIEIIDPLTGALKTEIPDRYLWGIQDVDGDGVYEVLLGKETERQPGRASDIEVVKLSGGAIQKLWSAKDARFAGRSLRPRGWRSNFRPVQFGHDETWADAADHAFTLFLFAGQGSQSLTEVTWNRDTVTEQTTDLGRSGRFIMSALADVDGDGVRECVLSASDGTILVARGGKIKASWQTGFRLQLEGFSAARPGPTPVVYRPSKREQPRIVIPDNTDQMHQLRVGRKSSSVTTQWSRPGRGWIGYDNSFHAAYICDIDEDGRYEIMATQGEKTSALVAFDSDARVKRSWALATVPPPVPTRIGLYGWVAIGTGAQRGIVGSYYSSYSMNSEQTVCVDMYNNVLWHRREYGEGEWGRGVGPWGAHAVHHAPDGRDHLYFLAKDLVCEIAVATGEWVREPWLLWRATNSVMNQPDWDFDKEHHADFGTAKDPFTAYGSTILVDVDHDGVNEILIGGCFGGFGMLRQDHSILWWERAAFTDVMLRLPGIADLSGNGQLCVGICHADGNFVCHDGRSGRELWRLDLGTTTSDVVSCDIDGDGQEEFITGTTDGRLIAIGVDGNGSPSIRWAVDLGFALGSPVIADANGDGKPEVLVVSGDGTLFCIGKEQQ